jgi:(p)ppGpp synthase/HD superfamily hydrolase
VSTILTAAGLAEKLHHGQKRKFTGRPYIEHPGRVAARISRHRDATEEMVMAAWLHDVIEDCDARPFDLMDYFHPTTVHMVIALTNPSKGSPGLPRAQRKEMDRRHIATCSRQVRMIKLADRTDNLREVRAGSEFATLYAAESRLLLEALAGTDRELEVEMGMEIVNAEVGDAVAKRDGVELLIEAVRAYAKGRDAGVTSAERMRLSYQMTDALKLVRP